MSNGRPWTALDDADLRRLVATGMTNAQIGDHMDRHEDLIRQKRKERGLGRGQSPLHTAMMARINYRRRMARMARA